MWHHLSEEEIIEKLNSHPQIGLQEKEVKIRQQKFGKNLLPKEKPLSKFKILISQFQNPPIYILIIAGIFTLFLKDISNTIIIWGTIFLNTLIGFFQENKTSKILTKLKKVIKIKAYVIREGEKKEIEMEELVPGDIILLHPGDKIPADGRLIETHNLKINESILTGEWAPAEKKPIILPLETLLPDRDNMVYTGCIVEEGRGKAIITETGLNTEIGKIAATLKEVKEEKTPYQKKIIHLSKFIGVLIIFLSFLVFFLGIIKERDISEMFLTTIALVVTAVPEGLPMAITIILTLGMQRILKKQGLVRQMIAAEILGSASIVCTDKTGTLTEGKMEVAGVYTGAKELLSETLLEKTDQDNQVSRFLALKIATLVNEAFIENPDHPLEKWVIRGRSTDQALLIAGIQAGLNKKELEKKELKINDLLFNSIYKCAATLHRLNEKENILYVLGAPEVILEKSKFLYLDEKIERLTSKETEKLSRKIEEISQKGQRILATAYRKPESYEIKNREIEFSDIKDLIFVGFIALHDPLRKDVKEAIKTCLEAGIKPIITTGDHKLTAKTIATELGIPAQEENIIEGKDLEKISDQDFQRRLDKIEIYARVLPEHKLKIVKAWQKKGKIVAMTGDGVNDAPALKQANIGIALNLGIEVAKEASDLILLNNSFSIIEKAIEEGRVIIDNIRKVVTLLLSLCFSEIILIGASIISGLPLPLLPAQILWQNLIEGSPQAIGLAFEPKEKRIMKRLPEDPKIPLLNYQMKTIMFIFGTFTSLILFSIFLWFFRKGLPIAEIRTLIFAALASNTLFYTFSCKNLRKNIWQYNPFSNLYLIFAVLFTFSMLLIAIYFPLFQNLLKTIPLNFSQWMLILKLGIAEITLIEIAKWYFIIRKRKD